MPLIALRLEIYCWMQVLCSILSRIKSGFAHIQLRDIVHLDGIAYDVEGVGDVHLLFASGASVLLRHVQHVPSMVECLISIPQLRDEGYCFTLLEYSKRLHRGSLVIARGARRGMDFPLPHCPFVTFEMVWSP